MISFAEYEMEQLLVHEILLQLFKKCLTTSFPHFPILLHNRKTGNWYFRVLAFFLLLSALSTLTVWTHSGKRRKPRCNPLHLCPFRKVQSCLLVAFPDFSLSTRYHNINQKQWLRFWKGRWFGHAAAGCTGISCRPCWVFTLFDPLGFVLLVPRNPSAEMIGRAGKSAEGHRTSSRIALQQHPCGKAHATDLQRAPLLGNRLLPKTLEPGVLLNFASRITETVYPLLKTLSLPLKHPHLCAAGLLLEACYDRRLLMVIKGLRAAPLNFNWSLLPVSWGVTQHFRLSARSSC